jgi:FMN reductase
VEVSAVKIVGVGGSLGRASTSLAALKIALDETRKLGADTELLDIRELNLPLFVPGQKDAPEPARKLAESVRRADGFIWSAPTYHGTVSGSFKNAIDWLQLLAKAEPPYLTDKPVGLIATAGGVDALHAINSMELMVRALRGITVSYSASIPQAWSLFTEGKLMHDRTESQIRHVGREVLRLAKRLKMEEDEAAAAGTAAALI